MIRKWLAVFAGISGIALYNWWILVPFRPGVLISPNELFSDLEVTGHPFAVAMQRADFAAGVLILMAFLLVGSSKRRADFREWVAMLVFAVAGAAGGLFPETCTNGISAACRSLEWGFRLPGSHYIHIVAGIVEFGSITLALVFAYKRTHGSDTLSARIYHMLGKGAFAAYLLLAIAYLFNVMGSVIEPVFFLGFSIIVVLQLFERMKISDS